MKAAQYGYDAVCIFGKGNSASVIEYLKNCDKTRNLCLCFDKDVIMNDISKFVKKIARSRELINLFYVDPSDMVYNDIADMDNKDILIKTVNKKKPVNELFINMMSIGE
jgi:hypothetical protein